MASVAVEYSSRTPCDPCWARHHRGTRPLALKLLLWTMLAFLAACIALPQTVHGDVEVILTDGRQIRAQALGLETDHQRLALRIEAARIQITRFVPWDKIASINLGHQKIELTQLQAHLAPLVAASADSEPASRTIGPEIPNHPADDPAEMAPPPQLVPALGSDLDPPAEVPYRMESVPLDAVVIGVRCDPLSAYADDLRSLYPYGIPLSETSFALDLMRAATARRVLGDCPSGPASLPPLPPVPAGFAAVRPPEALKSIVVHASPVSTHGNVDWDALAVQIRGLDLAGAPVPIRGTLSAVLWGQTQELVPTFGERVIAQPDRRKQLATWTASISGAESPRDYPAGPARAETAIVTHGGPDGVRLLLPLPRPFPEHELRIAPLADLHVQLTVPGIGTLEAAHPDVPLQQASAFRDRLLVETRSRFLGGERTADSRIPVGPLLESHTSLRPQRRVFTVQP